MNHIIHDTGNFYPGSHNNYCPQNAAAKTAILDVKNSCRFARDSFRVKSFNLWCPQNMSKLKY